MDKSEVERLKAVNRENQRKFYNTMKARGYKRRHNWYSERSVELLDELSDDSMTKELVIEEALEALNIIKKKWPDSQFSDAKTLMKLKTIAYVIPRKSPEHFEKAKLIIEQRIRKIKDLLVN